MPLMQFIDPQNPLEQGGWTAAPVSKTVSAVPDIPEAEPERTCPGCQKGVKESFLKAHDMVCSCGYHFRMRARDRVAMLVDSGSFQELFADMQTRDPLDFPGYQEKLTKARAASGEIEAVICGTAAIGAQPFCMFVMDAAFMMGSMGCVVGEKITALFEYAEEHALPVVGFTVSGGARMQEGLISLMQMAKTSAAVKRHSDAGLLYIAVLTDPTTGGVTASFAMEADIILAEPGATVGFAGARVVAQTTNQPLPDDFQTAEGVLAHGFIDRLVPRDEQRQLLDTLLTIHRTQQGAVL